MTDAKAKLRYSAHKIRHVGLHPRLRMTVTLNPSTNATREAFFFRAPTTKTGNQAYQKLTSMMFSGKMAMSFTATGSVAQRMRSILRRIQLQGKFFWPRLTIHISLIIWRKCAKTAATLGAIAWWRCTKKRCSAILLRKDSCACCIHVTLLFMFFSGRQGYSAVV